MSCVNAKQVIVIRRPTTHIWRTDFEAATDTLHALQEKIANTNAPQQHLLDKDQNPPFVRMSFPLWEKKVCYSFPAKPQSNYLPRNISAQENIWMIPLKKRTTSFDLCVKSTTIGVCVFIFPFPSSLSDDRLKQSRRPNMVLICQTNTSMLLDPPRKPITFVSYLFSSQTANTFQPPNCPSVWRTPLSRSCFR